MDARDRLPPFNPLARAIYQATNWLVLPLRKIIPAGNKIDWTAWWRPGCRRWSIWC